jgi:hypothetical protein
MPNQQLDEAFFKAGTSFESPIPGQSLTNDPDSPAPFEKAPKFTERTEVLEYYFEQFTDEEMYSSLMDNLQAGVTVMEIVQVLIYQGFQEGLYNPDLMLMIAEPLAYMIAALAERADVDFIIMEDDDEDDDEVKGEQKELPIMNQALKTIEKPQMDEDFPSSIATKLDTVKPPQNRSLLGER